jgi:hypothetical protein
MNFVDLTLVRLADPASRADVFDQTALEQLLGAAYDADRMSLEGPYSATFDEFHLGVSTPQLGTVDGAWRPTGSADHTEAQFRITGVGSDDSGIRVDALWRGAIIARHALGGEPITSVRTNWPGLGEIDAEISAANGGVLPPEPALEQARETRMLAAVRAGLAEPDAFTEDDLAAWVTRAGATSVGDLLEHARGTVELGSLKVQFAAPTAVMDTPQPLAVAIAIAVRGKEGFSLAQLLADSITVRDRLRPLGFDLPALETVALRHPVVVCWIVPETIFDDADWPGGDDGGLTAQQRQQRRRVTAGTWLAAEGIGLVTTPDH